MIVNGILDNNIQGQTLTCIITQAALHRFIGADQQAGIYAAVLQYGL